MNGIESVAGGIVERYGTSSPLALCDCMEIPVLPLDLPGSIHGCCFRNSENRPVIVLNRSLSGQEQEYCCAHELGHLLLHPDMNAQVIRDLTNLVPQRYEREADYFAACLFIDPHLGEWDRAYHPLTLGMIASLSGLPERIVGLRFGQ